MTKAKQVDSIVRAYITTDMELAEIVADADSRAEPIVEALNLLTKSIRSGVATNGAFLAATNVDVSLYDANICILFLICWAHACHLQASIIPEKLQEAWALIHRAKSLLSEDTAKELVCYVNIIESHLVSSDGNQDKQEEILANSLKLLSKNSPRRKHIIMESAANLALAGRLKDIEPELNKIKDFSLNFKKSWVSAVRFINFIETGNISQAAILIPEISRSDPDSIPLRNFQKYSILMDIISSPISPQNQDENQLINTDDSTDWAMVLQCLLANKVHQALRWARICEKRHPLNITSRESISFNLLRTELAESNIEAARRIIDIRHSHGNHHFLDDFFLARTALLEGNEDSAAELFASTVQSIEKYDAHGRLDFELRISSDIPRDALFRMMKTAERIRASKSAQHKQAKTPATAQSTPSDTNMIISATPVMDEIMTSIQHFAQIDVPVLITGETGTGKELVAKALHDSGPRARLPFVAINCGAISESLLESELFGHTKGAFSGAASSRQGLFEEAADGTIFLDEIGEITPRLQVALLRVLETNEIRPVGSSQSHKISCRIIASTNANLHQMEKDKRFRKDLIFRLKRLEIHLPALRERIDDILLLATHFLNIGRPQDVYATMSAHLSQNLITYSWPGNIRELRNTMERMRLMNSDKLYYDADDLDLASDRPTVILAPPDNRQIATPMAPIPIHTNKISPITRMKTGRSRVRRLANLRNMFVEHKLLTRNEIVQTLEISPNTATQDLKLLCSEGLIEKRQPSASPRSAYFVLKENS
jgi:DNA-binding NtrC family response regulator